MKIIKSRSNSATLYKKDHKKKIDHEIKNSKKSSKKSINWTVEKMYEIPKIKKNNYDKWSEKLTFPFFYL
jgi:hypothetical protein